MAYPLWKAFWWFLIKLIVLLPYDLAVVLVGVNPRD